MSESQADRIRAWVDELGEQEGALSDRERRLLTTILDGLMAGGHITILEPDPADTMGAAPEINMDSRHLGTRSIMRWLENSHLDGSRAVIVEDCRRLALRMLDRLPDDPELVVGLRHIVDAKDCFVRTDVARDPG